MFVLPRAPRTFTAGAISMEPTIEMGARFRVDMAGYSSSRPPERTDIIVFEDPRSPKEGRPCWGGADENKMLVKRVIGLPGENLDIRRGTVYIDGDRLPEVYLHLEADYSEFGPFQIPPGRFFVMGDNRTNSQDSRYSLGPIPLDRICGKVTEILGEP